VTGFVNNLFHARYDVLPGDTSFIMIGIGQQRQEQQPARTIVVENWLAELRREDTQ
jgi:hypothetical protein